ncbi:MAG TPA: tol-pal system protein YbgF [Bauldia sp.]|nr:tol-pal system protein YbgF [Bauldia sp.]
MNRLSRNLVIATIAGFTLAAQTTAGSAIQWPWKRDRPNEEIVLPPPETVPPGGDVLVLPPPTVTEVPLAPNDVIARLDRAEARIRELTGQVEELAFRLRQTQDQLQAALAGRPIPNANTAAAPPPGQDPLAAPQTLPGTGATVAAAEPMGGQVLIDVPQDQPIDLTAMARGEAEGLAPAAPTQVVSLGEPGADYERAYAAILAGDYDMAEASFRMFITTYPNDQRVPDAQYWLGESLFARGQYREAADEFLSGYKSYPTSGKAADTLLKLGLSLAGLGEREAACSTYAEVLKKYPNSSNALRQRVATEQAVARCG